MNPFLKKFVAFAIAAVMICGMLPVSALAVENHDHSGTSDIQPFTSTADLIEQVKEQLLAQGATHAEEAVSQDLVDAVESKSEYSYEQAEALLGLGFFNDREGSEGQISTAYLNLDETTMTALVESTLKAYYLDSIVEVEYVVEGGIVTAVTFSMRDSFAAGLDEIETGISGSVTEETEEAEEAAPTAVASYSVTATAEEAEEKPFPFTDVPNWAKTAVNYLYQRDIVSGVSSTKYGSNMNVTRGQAVMMIWRAMESPEPKGKNIFSDVKDSAYYADAVVWAEENGIVSGTGNGKFSPNDNITREQLVAIMYKLAQFQGLDVSEKAELNFKDAGKIASWAKEATKWAVAAGLVSGYEDNTFRPKSTATRAEYAQVLYKYLLNAHTLVHVDAVASTCTTEGNIEYWYCSKCGKLFADEKGKTQLEEKDIVVAVNPNAHNPVPVAEVSPTCTATGVAAHYKCACGLLVDSQGNVVQSISDLTLPATGHYPAEGDENTVFNWTKVETEDSENTALYFDPETGAITAGPAKIVTWTCDSVTFVCTGCGDTFTEAVTVDSYVMTEEWINNQLDPENTEGIAYQIAYAIISDYVSEKAMNYYGETGSAPTKEQLDQWAYEAGEDPDVQAEMNAQITVKAFELYQDLNSTIYVATCEGESATEGHKGETITTFTEELNATKIQLQEDWATMCAFNEYYSNYFGLVAPYWSSKNTETSPFGAVIYMCSQEEQPFIPNYDMDYMVSMLSQAFMSYVMQYGPMLDAMLEEAMALVDYEELDDIDKLLLLHDWLAENATFDMQSLVDITTGESSGNDPISFTSFGVLLNDQITKAEDATWDGGICLGYAATYALLIQQAFGRSQEDEAIVDFAKIQFLTNVAESSVASGDSGFGDGDSMFNSAHYLNAVKVGDNWYYIDACYDDISTEVISQQRVETEGNIAHTSFLIAPATWEEMYEENFQYMDSLYDGKVWQRVPDGEGGYVKMDVDGNQYTEAEADQIQEDSKDEDGNVTVQMFYYYEAVETDAETRYEDTTYEEAWFVSANSRINYDPDTQYFYYTSGAITSYSSLKDMFGDDEEDGDSSSSLGDSMTQEDMLEYKYDPSAQDKIVRRKVDQPNEGDTSDSSLSMSQATDEYCEVLFHFGYGTTGAQAQEQFESDNADSSFSTGTEDEEEDEIVTGAWYDLCQEDAVYLSNYPDLVHSTVIMDGKIYFNIANCIYTFNYTIDEIAGDAIENITTLELVKVKEYNEVTYASNGKRFTGMSFELSNSGETLYYHPVAAMSVRNNVSWTYDDYGMPDERTAESTLYVSIGTNLTNSYKDEDGEAYTVEARNFNPDYYRFMEEEEEDEGTNTNTEFMWCANIVEKMPVEDMLADLAEGASETVSVAAYCARDAFTEVRTTAYGLTAGEKVVEEGTALKHEYAADETEGTNICAVCLEDHEHDYQSATTEDVDFVWSSYEEDVTAEDGTVSKVTKLTAEAYVACANDAYCNVDEELEVTVTDNGDGSFTATAQKGTNTATETKTVDQVLHNVHDYGAPVYTWTAVTTDVVDAETGEVTGTEITGWTVEAVFTCEAEEEDCLNSEAEGERVVTVAAAVSNATGEYVATLTGPDGNEYTDTLHVYSNEKNEDGTYKYVTIVMDEGKDNYTATYTCTVCGETHVVTGAVTENVQNATCTENGKITYTASAKEDAVLTGLAGKTHGEVPKAVLTDEEVVEATGHKYEGKAGWSEDLTSCVVTYTCSGCDASYTRDAEVKMTEKVEPTCEADGHETYTATVYDDNGDVRDTFTKTKTLPATDHTYGTEPVVVWTYLPASETTEEGMNCAVHYECTVCGEELAQSVTKPVKGDDGVWTATYIYEGTTYTVTHEHAYTNDVCDCGHTRSTAENNQGSWG